MPDIHLIALAGTNGSGKDSAGELIAERYGYKFTSVTDLLRSELASRGLPPAREHMRELSAEWRRESGLGVLVAKAMADYQSVASQYKGLVIASMRNPGEADEVHSLGGTMVWLDADPRLRYQRLQDNAHNRGAVRAVDDQKTFEQFLAEEAAEMHKASGADDATLDMAAVKDRCDVFITNDSNNIELFEQELAQALNLVAT